MKQLQSYIQESLLDLDDIEISVDDIRESVEKFLKENYRGDFIISDQPNKDGKFEVSSNGYAIVSNKKIQYLTNDLFEFTNIKGSFDCSCCKLLKSLEGAPSEVKKDFDCSICDTLKSLEGAPEEVGGTFYCYSCESLESLEGAPKKVKKNFDCSFRNSLKSLEGAPEEVGIDFNCSYCHSLESLEGAPKEVKRNFYCRSCKISFTKEDVKKYSNVKGNIYNI